MTDGSEESKSTINRVCCFVVVVLASERQAMKAESESFHFRRDDGAGRVVAAGDVPFSMEYSSQKLMNQKNQNQQSTVCVVCYSFWLVKENIVDSSRNPFILDLLAAHRQQSTFDGCL